MDLIPTVKFCLFDSISVKNDRVKQLFLILKEHTISRWLKGLGSPLLHDVYEGQMNMQSGFASIEIHSNKNLVPQWRKGECFQSSIMHQLWRYFEKTLSS